MGIIEPTAIRTNGWFFIAKCRCGGILKYKYRHPQKKTLELHYWVKHKRFLIMEFSKTKIPLTAIDKIDDILKSV